MATYTPNLNLTKPEDSDFFSRLDQNGNMDIIDRLAVLKGTTTPTTATVGIIGQFYLDTGARTLYQCVSAEDGVYEWFNITLDSSIGLSPDVATALGLTGNAQVKDALEAINNNFIDTRKYRWEKFSVVFSEETTQNLSTDQSSAAATSTIYYSDSFEYKNGLVQLAQPVQSIIVSYDTYNAHDLTGKYAYTEQSPVVKHVAGPFTRWSGSGTYGVSATSYLVNASLTSLGQVASYNVSEYPNAIMAAGYYFESLGRPQHLGARIAVGSYTGSGTFGIGNENSLTFDFPPKRISIIEASVPAFGGFITNRATVFGYSYRGSAYKLVSSISGNTISWYNVTDAAKQLNASGVAYLYVAEG